jgi:arylsulfate sulfotransferase
VELLNLLTGDTNQVEPAVVDLAGNVIWYYDYDTATLGNPFPIKPLSNGNMLVNLSPPGAGGTGASGVLREINLAGDIIWEFTTDDLNQELAAAGFSLTVTAIHHDVLVLPNGNLILLTNHTKDFTDLPGYPGVTTVIGDALVGLDESRKPVWVWDTFDHLDVNRHPATVYDYTHGNAVIYTPDDGNLIFSMRHQNWVIKIDYRDGQGTGDILWRLGYEGDFTLASGAPAAWQYAQHAPRLINDISAGIFKLAIFDNGNGRLLDTAGTVCDSPGADPCYSRGVIFNLNESTKAAEVYWEYKSPDFAFFGGDIQVLENGNVELDEAGFEVFNPNARVLEVTGQPNPEIVWQLDVAGQFAYQAFRIPSLYPGVQW